MVHTKQTMIAAAFLLQAHAQEEPCVCDTEYYPVHVWLAMDPYPACVTYPNPCRALCDGHMKDVEDGRCPIPGEPIEGCMSSKEYFPVCGPNGVTYSNPSVAACHQIYDATDGACAAPAPPPADDGTCTGSHIEGCTHIATWDPVCGSNGFTYSNAGEAACYSVTEYEKGACFGDKKRGGKGGKGKGGKGGKGKGGKGGKAEPTDEPNCDEPCVALYDPLMAIDYLTFRRECTQFSNECEAWCAGIPEADKRGTDRKDGQYWLEDGVCPKAGEYIPGCVWLIPLFDWVCGTNGVTYQNPSEAHCNGIFKYTSGMCKEAELFAPDLGM